jgi:hypothetical protein
MPWSDLEHGKCTKLMEKAVEQARQMHRQEQATASSPEEQRTLDDVCRTEMNELALLTEAVSGRDAIGVCAVATALWKNKAALQRRAAMLELKLPGPRRCAEWVQQLSDMRLKAVPAQVASPRHPSDVSPRRPAHEIMEEGFHNGPSREQDLSLAIHASAIAEARFDKLCEISLEMQRRIAELEAKDAFRLRHARALLSEVGEADNDDERVGELLAYATRTMRDLDEGVAAIADRVDVTLANPTGMPDAHRFSLPADLTLPDCVNWAILRRAILTPADEETATNSDGASTSSAVNANPTARELAARHGMGKAHLTVHSESYDRERRLAELRARRQNRVLADTSAAGSGADLSRQTSFAVPPAAFPLDAPLPDDAVVSALAVTPASGLDECIASLDQRIAHVETVALAQFEERVVEARDRIWDAEVSFMTARAHNPETDRQHHEGVIAEYRSHLHRVEAEKKRLEEALLQSRQHRDALINGDVRNLSYMLEAHHVAALADVASHDRVVYATRELEGGESEAHFVERLGFKPEEVFFFTARRTDAATGKLVERRMAYVPTAVPRTSLAQLDHTLEEEILAWRRRAASSGSENAPSPEALEEVLEQLAALRRSDAATLSEMLSRRREVDGPLGPRSAAAAEAADAAAAKLQGVQNELQQERRGAAELRATLDAVRSAIRVKDDALARLEEHARRQREQVELLNAATQQAIANQMASSAQSAPAPVTLQPGSDVTVSYTAVALGPSADVREHIPPELRSAEGNSAFPVYEFVDGATQQRMAYVPTMAKRANPAGADAALRTAIETGDSNMATDMAAALGALRSGDAATLVTLLLKALNRAREALRARITADVSAGKAKAELSSALSEAARLKENVDRLRQAARRAESQLTGKSDAAVEAVIEVDSSALMRPGSFVHNGSEVFSATMETSISGEDDSKSGRAVLLKKLELLRDALKRAKAREEEWKALLDQYQTRASADLEASLHDATSATSALQKRLDAKTKLLEAQAVEMDNLRAAVDAAEHKREAEMACMVETRRKLLMERDATIADLKQQLDHERAERQKAWKLLEAEGD